MSELETTSTVLTTREDRFTWPDTGVMLTIINRSGDPMPRALITSTKQVSTAHLGTLDEAVQSLTVVLAKLHELKSEHAWNAP